MSRPTADGSGPIFLAGGDRSGIGLLGEILECHPSVAMTRRTDYWVHYAGRLGDLTDPDAVGRAVATMMRDSRMRVLTPELDRLVADFARGEPTDARLFELLQVQRMQRCGCSRWGDKSLGSERFAGTILTAFPTARMVHVLRDPRDRYASQKHHRGVGRGGAGAGAAMWRWSEQLATRNSRVFAGRYQVVRYEDLVADPDETLERVRSFLELDEPIPSADAVAAAPLTTASVGRHRGDLSRAERRFVELTTRGGMARRGYEPEPLTDAITERIAFWAGVVPLETFHAAMWRPAMEIRQHRGRGPSDRRLASHEPGAEEPK